jgi:O-antigen ligase
VRVHAAAWRGSAVVLCAVGVALLTAFALVEVGTTSAAALAAAPLLAIGAVYVITSGQTVLFAAAVALPMIPVAIVGSPLIGQATIQDLIACLALGALVFAAVVGRDRVPPVPWTPVLGWPFVVFSVAILAATVRGHYSYGASLVGQPLRLVLYAAIVAGLIGMTVPRLHRLLVALFYPGAVVVAIFALYYLVVGGSLGQSADLSTGGIRPLAISTSIYAAGALFLALLNFRSTETPRERLLHGTIACIALFGVVAGFGRAVYLGVFIVGIAFLVFSRQLRSSLLSIAPLAAPVVVLVVVGVGLALPSFLGTVSERVGGTSTSDINVVWRVEANRAIFEQVRESPWFGVGFGRRAEFYLTVRDRSGVPSTERVEIGQDPHNGYLFLLAGGGIVALGSFLALLGVYIVTAVRKYRGTSDPEARLLVLWSCATLFVFLLNAASGTSFESPVNVLTIWALLVLPAVVDPAEEAERARADSTEPPLTLVRARA